MYMWGIMGYITMDTPGRIISYNSWILQVDPEIFQAMPMRVLDACFLSAADMGFPARHGATQKTLDG